jgi:uncharacterized membrane protein YgcG
MKLSATARWIVLALVGLAIAGGVAIAASRLASEQIGIASESVSAGEDLAPAVRSAAGGPAGGGTGTTPSTGPEPTVPVETTEADDHGGESTSGGGSGSDDHGGEDHSGHGGGGGSDD